MRHSVHIPHEPLSRRTFLRGAGVALALPLLDAMHPTFGTAARAADAEPAVPRRILAIETNQGILPGNFFPKKAGRDYELSPYLSILKPHRDNLTVFSGVSHPEVDGGPEAEICFLTGAPHPLASNFRNTISLDQFAAEQIGTRTRFPSLTVQLGPGTRGLSYSRNGVMIPPEQSPAEIYRRMFVQGNPQEVAARLADLRRGRSLLDFVGERAKKFVSFATAPLKLPGVSVDTHNLSHHGGGPDALKQLETIERATLAKLCGLLDGLSSVREGKATLLDRTIVLYGSNMGDTNSHSNTNLPVLLAGGGFKHGQHLAFDTKTNYPLANLYVSMLQRLGIEADKFSSGKGTMRDLETV